MTLVYYHLNEVFELKDNGISIIVFEDHSEFERMGLALYESVNHSAVGFQCEYKNRSVDLFEISECVFSLPDLRFDKKVMQKALIAETSDVIYGSETEEMISEIHSEIIEILDKIIVDSGYDLEYSDDWGITGFLKRYEIQLRQPDGSFAERLENYCEVMNQLLGKKVFFLINCAAYFDKQTIDLLETWALYEQFAIIFIENRQRPDLLNYEQCIVDQDMCIIR